VSRPRRLASPDRVPRPGTAATEGAEGCGKLQIDSLFCKPICKPDAARQDEARETESTSEMGPGLSAEVTTPARDSARGRRHTSYGS
jgi:hypothetical protein